MKTMNEMREQLSNELDALIKGEITIGRAQAAANLAGKYLHSIRLQLEYIRLKQSLTTISIPALENRHD